MAWAEPPYVRMYVHVHVYVRVCTSDTVVRMCVRTASQHTYSIYTHTYIQVRHDCRKLP